MIFGNTYAMLRAMGTVDRKQALFESVVRLRRAGRKLPGDRDISAVRATLERELGETVSRRFAARMLGVSHTALGHWIKAGDLPVLYSSEGRFEVPVPALLDLYEAVQAERDGTSRRYVLAPTMTRRREAARRLRIDRADVGEHGPHGRAQARSLAYHRVLARRLRKPMVGEARHVLCRWREQGRIDPHYAERWERLLDRPLPEIRRALVDENQEADDLRQNSPFAGVLSEPERRRIVHEIA